MQDEELTRLLRESPPLPIDQAAKQQALFAAMRAFDRKKSSRRQGMTAPARLIHNFRNFAEWMGDNLMKTTYALAGGACLAVLAVTLLSNTALTGLMPERVQRPDAPKIADVEPRPASMDALVKRGVQAPVAGQALPAPAAPSESAAPAAPMAATPPQGEAESKGESQAPGLAEPRASAPPVAAAMQKSAKEMPMAQQQNANLGAAPSAVASEAAPLPAFAPQEGNLDKFQRIQANPVKVAKEEPVSTFSIDVDSASYSFVRASLNGGYIPARDVVRVEEMVNYFPYDYAAPKDKAQPFATQVAVFPTPWNKNTKLLHIGIKGYELEQRAKPHANLVFLVDTSGSMNADNRLPLLVQSLKLMLDSLKPDDSIAIVTYAGNAGVALEPTPARERAKIVQVLEHLQSGGSTAGAEGIRTAYELAARHFDKNGVNRVILATDGDFNVGVSSEADLKTLIEQARDTGISLSVLGFGRGNYNDATMQTLAQNGNGNAAYIDTLGEARKVLVEEAGATLFTIAKDVKIQVEFNPAQVAEYRLIGYETRLLNREDFNNDKIDAGEIGAGHAVTALYEITPVGSPGQMVDELRYGRKVAGQSAETPAKEQGGEYAFVKIRYKLPEGSKSTLLTTPVDAKAEYAELAKAPQESRFAASVAAFGQLLRSDSYLKEFSYDDDIALAVGAKGEDAFGYRAEFINLVRLAKQESANHATVEPQPDNEHLK